SYDKPREGSALAGITDQHKLYFHRLGTSQEEDELIFGGPQTPRRYIDAYLTDDERFLVISAANTTTGGELYIQDLSIPDSRIVNIVDNFENNHDIIDNMGDTLFIYTNLQAPNGRVVKVDARDPGVENWVDF